MIKASFDANDKDSARTIEALNQALSPEQLDKVVDKVSLQIFRNVVEATPKKWFGQARKSWQIAPKSVPGQRVIFNNSRQMIWLEKGTAAHGPVTAKALFIPLTKRAAIAYAGASGFEATTHVTTDANWQGEVIPALRVFRNVEAKGVKKTVGVKLIYGVDYVLAQWVKGIRPRFIVAYQRIVAETLLHDAVKRHIRDVLIKRNG